MRIYKSVHHLIDTHIRGMKYLILFIIPLMLFYSILADGNSQHDNEVVALSFMYLFIGILSAIIYLAICIALMSKVYQDNLARETNVNNQPGKSTYNH